MSGSLDETFGPLIPSDAAAAIGIPNGIPQVQPTGTPMSPVGAAPVASNQFTMMPAQVADTMGQTNTSTTQSSGGGGPFGTLLGIAGAIGGAAVGGPAGAAISAGAKMAGNLI